MATFDYRRELTRREILPAIGAGVGAGLAVAYLAQLWLRREPISPRPVAARPHPARAEESA